MKKELFAAVVMVGFVSRALAQGTILFANDNNGLLKGVVWGVQMYEDLVRAPAYVQVFAAPGGTPFHAQSNLGSERTFLNDNPGFCFMGSPTPILPQAPGRFNGGSITISNTYPGGAC